MKIKNIILLLVLSWFIPTSCTDFLNEDDNPNNLSQSKFWKTEADIDKGLAAVYSRLQPNSNWGAPFERYIVTDNYRSDESDFRADVPEWTSIAMFNNTPNNYVSKNEWFYLYEGINYANQCVTNIPKMVDVSEGVKSRSLAEARFLRAYYYYRLFTNFGERLPLFTKQIEGSEEEYYPLQSETGVIRKFIEEELIAVQADGQLPDAGFWAGDNAGRATKYAAAGILAKYYMFTNQMAKAEVELAKIVNSSKFTLLANYADLFDGNHKNSTESVFEVQFSGNSEGSRSEYSRIALHLSPLNTSGYEESYPSRWLYETMKLDVKVGGGYSDRLYSTILFDDPNTEYFRFDEIKPEELTKFKEDLFSNDAIYWHKFNHWEPSQSQRWYYSVFNIPIVRYADVLLLYAECLNDRGASAEAISYINIVRNRVSVTPLISSLSKAEVITHLQDVERPCELALEGGRWYDLIRWGIVGESLTSHSKPFSENFLQTKHTLYPIPHEEFLLNPEWEQNPNFSK